MEYKPGTLLKAAKDLRPVLCSRADGYLSDHVSDWGNLGITLIVKDTIVEVIEATTQEGYQSFSVWIPSLQVYCHRCSKTWFKPANE